MREAKIAGHIININSILGHNVVNFTPPCLNLYPATKFAITALSESLIQEIRHFKEKIKVTVSLDTFKTSNFKFYQKFKSCKMHKISI